MIEAIGEAFTAILEWIGIYIKAALEWGWANPSETTIIVLCLSAIALLCGLKRRR